MNLPFIPDLNPPQCLNLIKIQFHDPIGIFQEISGPLLYPGGVPAVPALPPQDPENDLGPVLKGTCSGPFGIQNHGGSEETGNKQTNTQYDR